MFRILFLLPLLIAQLSFAAPFSDFPGTIPLKYERQAASDLVFKGKILLPDEARKLYESGQIKDLADLNPISDSVIWKNELPKGPFTQQDEMGLNIQYDEFDYVSETEVPNGRFGFIVSKKNIDGKTRSYQILFDVQSHNVLLRKTLLRKLGYQVPPTQRLAKFKIRFKGAFSKSEFVKEIERKTFLENDRWIVEGKETEDGDLIVQDAIVFEGTNDSIYNLARGDMSASVIQGRRLMNALLVPYNFTDVTESLNVFPWNPGRIFNSQLSLPYADAEEFSTSYEDARWITRRILKLTRADLQDVVASAEYPLEVANLLLEKLVARRNFLREKLNLITESVELPVDSKISTTARLQQGKLIGEKWDGYASRFAATDPDSPLSGDEIFGLFKSKAMSNVISNVVSEFNNRYVPKADLGYKLIDHQLDVAAHQFAQFITTGEVKAVPFGFWATPTYNGNVIISREVVAGNYLGSENLVQVADTVGVAADYGIFIGADGLPAKVMFNAQAKAFLVRTYTHLKPIHSIKAALKEPFRNMIVPWLKSNQANPIDRILDLEKSREKLGEEEFDKQLKEQLEEFKKRLGVGESLIVQTSVGPDLSFAVGYGITKDLQAYVTLRDKLTALTRLHIYRKDENTIQIYRDPAVYNVLDISLGLNAKIQVLDLGWSWIKGSARTEFYQLDVSGDLEANPKLFENLAAVRRVLRQSRTDAVKKIQKPWLFDHDFAEKDFHFNFLWLRYLSANSFDKIKITHPEGQAKDFIRKTIGKRTGNDYESVTIDVVESLVSEYTGKNVNLNTTNNGNPGDTFKGKSYTHQVNFEGEIGVNNGTSQIDLSNAYLGIDYRWKGWDISNSAAQNILDKMSQKYGQNLFPKFTLNETKKIQFYSIELTVNLYEDAVQNLISLTDAQIGALYASYNAYPNHPKEFLETWMRQFSGYIKKIKSAHAKGDTSEVAEKVAKLVNHAESTLTYVGFKTAVGGEQNLFAKGVIRGFRVGDENGDNDIFSHTLGQIGSTQPSGPLRSIQNQVGVGEGEMFIYWLLNRL